MMKMDGRDSAECKNWEKRDKMVILEFVLNKEKTKYGIVFLLQLKCNKENVKNQGRTSSRIQFVFLLERVFLLSRNTGDSTVGSLRDKKEIYSTWSGLHVDTGFEEF